MVAVAERVNPIDIREKRRDGAVVPSRYHVGLVTVLGAIFLVALAPRLDTDLWWHLLDGATIAARHAPPTSDHLSFTFAGHPWTDHEWLSDLLLYGLYRLAGLWGTIAGFALVICASFALVYARMVRIGANRMLSLFVLAGAFISSSATWGARPQMLTLLFLALYALALEYWFATRNSRLLLVFPLAMILWANLHGGWVLGLGFLALSLLGEWANRATKLPGALSTRVLRMLAGATGITLLATLLNPAGLREVLYPLVWIAPSDYSNVLSEWVSTDFHQPVNMVFEGMLLALVASAFIGGTMRRPNWRHLILILAFTHLALSQSRNVAVWTILISPLLALYLTNALATIRLPGGTSTRRLNPAHERVLNVILLLVTGLLYVVETMHFSNPAALRRAEAATFPAGATTYLLHHRLPARVFNSYAWGGYLLWRAYPEYRDFIDGRANTLFDDHILQQYLTAYTAAPGWAGVLRRYRVGTVLVEPGAPLAQVLAESRGWHRAYADRTAVVYVHGSQP